MTASPTLDPKLRNRLLRYLHTGIEIPKYFPGCWTAHKYFEDFKPPVLQEVFLADKNNTEVVNIILKAFHDGHFTRFETIAFTLAKCLYHGSERVKEITYRAALEVCKTPEEMMMFNNFLRHLKTGNGRGWCNFIKKWYVNRDPMELAKEVTRVRARHGRSHKTLVAKSHMKIDVNDYARDATIKYIMYGIKRARTILANAPGTEDIFDYIEKVESMRHCEDPKDAAKIAEENHFILDHVPGHLLTSQEVWEVILPQMPLQQVLHNIQRIHNMGFLTESSTTTAILCSLLTNNDKIKASKVTPIEVFIIVSNYERNSKPLKYEKAIAALEKQQRRRQRQTFNPESKVWEWTVTQRHPKEVKIWGIDQKPNKTVIATLHLLINHTWTLTTPTKARYLITLDMRDHMFKGLHFCEKYAPSKKSKRKDVVANNGGGGDVDNVQPAVTRTKIRQFAECFYNSHVSPGNAAIILMLQLLKREKHVKVAVFTEQGIELIDGKKCNDIEGTAMYLKKQKLGRVQLDAPIEWASKLNEKFDVFINMIDRSSRYMELEKSARGGRGPAGRFGPPPTNNDVVDHCPVRALERYRTKTANPDAKLIVMSLASHRSETTDGSHEGILDIVGIDEHVPKVMDAFVLGQFK
ncbi:unnamed protein product [Pieris brassicae]|uniref:TROVE domain-containing protein n=1 Tax=Pieris brassicae TaxID=7116 RepID=A0A9P0X798_PIEBR|nr:unnamed protein product [Pieris brassicae]